MSGAAFILAINMAVAGLLAAAFFAVAVYDTQRVSARWMAVGYLLGVLYSAIEFVIPAFDHAIPVVVVAFATLLCGAIAVNAGLARKYSVATPWRTMALFLVVATISVALVEHLPRQSMVRMMAYQLPYAVMLGIGTILVYASKSPRQPLDYLLMGLLLASGLQFLAKPFIAIETGGSGANPQTYLESSYAQISQSLGTVFGLAIALLLLVMFARDILAEATIKSETDALSSLLNRRGFESQARGALRHAARQGAAVSLVITDLDDFKSINDNFGHESGDLVIKAFGALLHDAKPQNSVVGRIGGEEFAILLPGSHLGLARLFAEGTRSAFGAMPIDGLPEDRRCSASFGVAEWSPGEGFGDLMRRADQALYAAKKGGRDRVLAAAPYASPPASERPINGRG